MSKTLALSSLVALCVTGTEAFAAAGAVKMINYYELLLGKDAKDWIPTAGAVLTLVVILLVGSCYKSAMAKEEAVVPDGKFSVRSIVDLLLDVVYDLGKGILGEKHLLAHFPLLSGLFIFILFSNLSGLVPGFLPATDSINTNLAMGAIVFLAYNIAGAREHGMGYIKQYIGPVAFMVPLMLIIETVGHLARPLSLSLRLYGNIFGDHLVLSVFTGLTVLVFPAVLLFFGLLVASLQSFVFTLLTSIYISMAVSHDH